VLELDDGLQLRRARLMSALRIELAGFTDPRRALGHLLGNGVRFPACAGTPAELGKAEVLIAGEGIETVLSLKCVLPAPPIIAALSANHLAAIEFAPMLARLYVARARDAAGRLHYAWPGSRNRGPRSRADMERLQRGPVPARARHPASAPRRSTRTRRCLRSSAGRIPHEPRSLPRSIGGLTDLPHLLSGPKVHQVVS
jgi:Toprim domain